MMRFEHTIEIGPPIDEVFGFITEPLNDPARLSSVLDVQAPRGRSPSAAKSSRR